MSERLKTENVNVRMTPILARQLEALAESRQLNPCEMVRDLVAKEAERAGIVSLKHESVAKSPVSNGDALSVLS
jgi:hypothetical protein